MSHHCHETTDPSTSPARKSRQQEKEELAYLNDRFASYIEQVRSLKETNLRYEFELQNVKGQVGRESEDIKKMFEAELTDARTLIDETAKEKARQQLIASKNASRVKELETEMKELKEELEAMKNRVLVSERSAASSEAQRKAAYAEKSAFTKEMREKDAEIEELRANIEELRALLESETLSKVDYQNNLQSLNEELSFRKKVYEEELHNLHKKIVQSSSSFSESFESFQEGQLETAIDELREKSDMDIAGLKSMLEAAYVDKISRLESQSSRDAATIAQLNMDLRKSAPITSDNRGEIARLQRLVMEKDTEIEELKGEIAKLQRTVGDKEAEISEIMNLKEIEEEYKKYYKTNLQSLEAEVTSWKDKLDMKDNEITRMSQKYSSDIAHLTNELRALRESYDVKIREYEVLMDLKVQLDQEIATYRALLQEEETRLNLTPTPRGEKRRSRTQTTTEQATKKPRLDTPQKKQSSTSSSAAGCTQICEVDPLGRFVQIKNLSKSTESIGGFKIVHDVAGEKEIAFKFHQKSKLQGGASATVWGCEASGAVHSPPHDIIWRTQPSWGAGSNAVTKLISKTGEVVATFTQRSESSPAKSRYETVDSAGEGARSFPHLTESSTERDSASASGGARTTRTTTRVREQRVGEEHMFHQQGDPQEPLERNGCIVS